MNFHKNQTNIQDLLRDGWRKKTHQNSITATYNKGVYILSVLPDDDTMKIGMASGLGGIYQRLAKQYKICFHSDEHYWLRYMFISPEKDFEYTNNRNCRKKKGITSYANELECILGRAIGKLLKTSYSNEWIKVTRISAFEGEIKRVLEQDSHRKLWTHVIKFYDDGWKIIKNSRDISVDFSKVRKTFSKNDINGLKGNRLSKKDRLELLG